MVKVFGGFSTFFFYSSESFFLFIVSYRIIIEILHYVLNKTREPVIKKTKKLKTYQKQAKPQEVKTNHFFNETIPLPVEEKCERNSKSFTK